MSVTTRETYATRFGMVLTMVGCAVGLGNVWRFPYMVGAFGGAAFVLFYVAVVVLLGVPALMAEWALGRATRRGPVGAFARAGLPGGRAVGWFFFLVILAATAYYCNALGWVLFYSVGQAASLLGIDWQSASILPPDTGFDGARFTRQLICTSLVIAACAGVLIKGLRQGIERASKVLIPMLFICLLVLIARVLTLDGAWEGVRWYIAKVEPSALTPTVMVAALGQACFTLSLGGTFMVVYGSYLKADEPLGSAAIWTAIGDTGAGLLAGLAILPAVIALGLDPTSGPGLLFFTLPEVFARLPAGGLFGLVFYVGLLGAAYLSAVGAFEVMVAGLLDNTRLTRRQAVFGLSVATLCFALPTMTNMRIFGIWDLTFGSGMQTLGALVAVITVGWLVRRATLLEQLGHTQPTRARAAGHVALRIRLLIIWLRFVIPAAMTAVGIWWLLSDVLGAVGAGS